MECPPTCASQRVACGIFRGRFGALYRRGRCPGLDDSIDVRTDECARIRAGNGVHEHALVFGVLVPDRSDDGQLHRFRIQCPAGAGPPDPSTTTGSSVTCNAKRPLRWATGELRPDGGGEFADELLILDDTTLGVALAASLPKITVSQALLLGLCDSGGLREDTLPLVSLARPAPLHHDCRQLTGPSRSAGQCRVPARQEFQVTEVGAVQAERTSVVHGQEVASYELG